uniref:Conotoxin ArMLKM-01 n=1 Tax=Conus arenatus TaxID=89451 RepID=CM31_CONAE|nr:RecName: Full=Conotoxin ArMLKM-01; Flags: Precursor [Conus arenatus]AAG60380.1 conotoxin scaffold III/IV precursor [Conus arenatus]
MLKMEVVLFTFLVLFPLSTLQLETDQPVERYVENKQDLNPDESRNFMLPIVKKCCTACRMPPCKCCA